MWNPYLSETASREVQQRRLADAEYHRLSRNTGLTLTPGARSFLFWLALIPGFSLAMTAVFDEGTPRWLAVPALLWTVAVAAVMWRTGDEERRSELRSLGFMAVFSLVAELQGGDKSWTYHLSLILLILAGAGIVHTLVRWSLVSRRAGTSQPPRALRAAWMQLGADLWRDPEPSITNAVAALVLAVVGTGATYAAVVTGDVLGYLVIASFLFGAGAEVAADVLAASPRLLAAGMRLVGKALFGTGFLLAMLRVLAG